MNIKNKFDDEIENCCKKGYNNCYKIIRDKWINEKKFKDFLQYCLNSKSYDKNYEQPFLDALLTYNELFLFKIYWKTRLSEEIRYMWELISYYRNEKDKKFTTKDFLSYDRKILDKNEDKYPAYQDGWLKFVWYWYNTLDFIDRYVVEMQKINATEEIERAKSLKESVFNLKKPKAKKTTDKRKMNETLFWELIKESREESDIEFLDILKNKLESMGISEIKNFQKLLLEKTNELEHWDIWALAYIVRRGCGDDAFDYFKAWVISQGKETFEIIKKMEFKNLKNIFENDDPQFEEFMYVAQEAYENKKYEEMSMPRVKSQPMQGKEWSEENICKSYPKICKIFEYSF